MDTNKQAKPPRSSDISLDALVDDLIGLNLRAVKTLWDAFRHPLRYIESAQTVDWLDRHTPSFRLWFTLVAGIFFFQFLWAGNDSALMGFYASQISSSGVELPSGVDATTAAISYTRINFALLPIIVAVFLFVFGFIYRAWSEPTHYVVRVRYVFAVTIPGTALSLPIFVLMGYAQQDKLAALLAVSWFLPLIVDIWVAYRGVYFRMELPKRFLYSLFLSLALLISNIAASIISGTLSNVWLTFRYG